MFMELIFGTVAVLTTVYMCNMINHGAEIFGYRRFHTDDYHDSSSDHESEFHAFNFGSAEVSPRSSRWSSTTFSSDDSDDDDRGQDLAFTDSLLPQLDRTPTSSSLPNGNHEALDVTITPAEAEITETDIESLDLDSPAYHRLELDPRYTTENVEIPWIVNPLFQDSAVI
ncbi:hypothetical protein R1sor_015887 [Riccia sorocarpa]|uniref:Uncharacterized protein n=1 Tax=Riccia sorocarpa TaxID=122646 RepID=A0ABD3HDU6_9MARC